MKILLHSPKKAIKAFLRQKPTRRDINSFKANLVTLLDKSRLLEKQVKDESEEHLKNNLRDFLLDSYYKQTNAINTKGKKDLVIHLGKDTNSNAGVIIEAKRPTNISEMVSVGNLNKKAFHELVLYYFDERNSNENNQLKQLIVTSVYEWFIFDANVFDKYIYRDSRISALYKLKTNDKKDTPFFYEELAKILSKSEIEIPCVYFDIRDYEKFLRNDKKSDDKELITLLKIFSSQYLLKTVSTNDNNSLNEKFYKELLHIIGLEEAKEEKKTIIRRKIENRNPASLLELTIEALNTEDVFHRLPDISIYGPTKDDRVFNIGLELCIIWINRLLFLKLLEGQLVAYHQGDISYKFLNSETIYDFDELFKLFHKVLAVNVSDRTEAIKSKYNKVPYLNSSLFEISDLEDQTIKINSLDNGGKLELIKNITVLTDTQKTTTKLPFLGYLFKFLDAYDFSSEGSEAIQEENKSIINASVLGKVFEKINGYKDGSIFTPAFITMYMSKQSIRLAVLQKFNEAWALKNGAVFESFDDLRNYTSKIFKTQEVNAANEIINSLRICDPAVGSGHFLVSALNEIIVIKSDLGILSDNEGNLLRGYEIEVINDELIITDYQGNPVEYRLENGRPANKELQHLQKTIFHEKQNIIENCLFGVDINPKSVLICRLRLWIELLKNAYYKESTYNELETLPNIDINIKCGNSLVSRFKLDADLSKALKSIKYDIQAYREFVNSYKNEKSRDIKRGLQKIISSIKSDFRTEINRNDPKVRRLEKLTTELIQRFRIAKIEFDTEKEKELKGKEKVERKKIESEIDRLTKEIEAIKTNAVYKNAFEWRFEFPEVLNNNGDFEGFDVIVGNPPYIQLQKLEPQIKIALEAGAFETFTKTGDIYQLFYEKGTNLLKEKGQLSYITSNKWMRTDYGKVTRTFLSTKCKTWQVVDFGMAQMFDSATTYTNILFSTKDSSSDTIKMCRIKEDYNENILLEDYVDFASVEMDNPGEKSWIAYSKKEYALIQKIVSLGKPIKEWDILINRGILTGYNEAFIIDTETRDRLVKEDPNSATIIKPILRGEDIKAFTPQWANLWIIGTFPSLNLEISEYPAIEKYLTFFKERLTPKPKDYDEKRGKWKGRKSGAYEWFETQDSISYYEDFLKPKIIYPNMTKFLPFVYDKHQFFTNQKCFIITGDKLCYLTAFFNSKVFRFAFKEYFPELLGDTRELSKVFFETIAVIPIDNKLNEHFEVLIDKIQEFKNSGKKVQVLVDEIDNKIFSLYSLSTSEISLINSSETIDNSVELKISRRSESVSI